MLDTTVAAHSDAHNRAPEGDLRCYSIRAPRWAVAYTHPQAERWANANLSRIGYVTYLPLVAVRIRDRHTPIIHHLAVRPLFSRYLFIQFNHLADSWSPIRSTPGVVDLIRTGPDVHYAPEAAVDALRAGEDARRSQTAETHQWAPGALVAPRYGPFQGLPAVITAIEREMASITLMFLGQLRELSVSVECLVARDE